MTDCGTLLPISVTKIYVARPWIPFSLQIERDQRRILRQQPMVIGIRWDKLLTNKNAAYQTFLNPYILAIHHRLLYQNLISKTLQLSSPGISRLRSGSWCDCPVWASLVLLRHLSSWSSNHSVLWAFWTKFVWSFSDLFFNSHKSESFFSCNFKTFQWKFG